MVYNKWFGPLPKPNKWVFIVGCYNSGTTLLHNLLSNHSHIGSMPDEGQFFTDQLLLPKSVGLPRLWAIEPELFRLGEKDGKNINVNRLKRQWGAHYNDLKKPVLIEKSPPNAARTHWIQANFENAYFIGIIRNGYAVAEGIRRKGGHRLEMAANQWVNANEIMLEDFDKLKRKKIIRYEDICDSPGKILGDLMVFLGLNATFLGFKEEQTWKIHEQESKILNMNSRSIEALSPADIKVINSVASEMLMRLGYNNIEVT